MFLSANDKVMRGKKGTGGVHIMKTVQAIIVSVYKEPVLAEQVTLTLFLKMFLIFLISFSAPLSRKSWESTWWGWDTS